jgi:hypothetical protein
VCPNFLLFRCFHLRLIFESIKELGSASRTIFNPSTSYQIFDHVEEEIDVTIAQVTTKKTNGSPNENTQQSTKIRTPNEA